MIEAAETALRGRLRQAGDLRFGGMEVFRLRPGRRAGGLRHGAPGLGRA